jgi:uncharacterized repeat protein (TIGR01451 family)
MTFLNRHRTFTSAKASALQIIIHQKQIDMKKFNQFLIACCLITASAISAKAQVACHANFQWNVNPNGVFTFYDSSFVASGYTTTSWSWNFGDGSTSTQQNPTKNYTAPGTYNVCLKIVSLNTATQSYCLDSICKSVVFSCPTFISGNWTFTTQGLTAAFSATYSSNSPPLKYEWNFGDGDTSSLQSPTHNYLNGGVYTVCLKIRDNFGCYKTECKVVTVQPVNACTLQANYYHTLNGSTIGFQANDSSFAGGSVIINRWFIDGTQIATCNGAGCTVSANVPQYVGTGIRNVCLIAKIDGTNCTDTFCKQINFGTTTNCNVQANFSFSQPNNSTIVVTSSTTGGNPTANAHVWTLGGVTLGTSTGNGVSKTFTIPNTIANGASQLCLKVEVPNVAPACKDTICKNIVICKANAEFAYQILTSDTVKFSPSQSSLSGYTHVWTVNGTPFSTNADPKHKFNVPINGLEICHIVSAIGSNCTDTFCVTLSSSPCNLNAGFQWVDSSNANGGNVVLFFPSNTGISNLGHVWTFGDGTSSTSASPDHAYAQPGTYTVCHKIFQPNNLSCKDSVCKVITVGNNTGCNMVVTVVQSTNPNNQIILEAVVSGGKPPYTYSWNTTPAQTTKTINATTGGVFVVTVTDSTGCVRTFTKVVTAPANAKLCGVVFNDANGNGVKDSNEVGFGAYVRISGNGQTFTLFSDSITGNWDKYVSAGTYEVCVYTSNTPIGGGLTPTVPINSNSTPNQGVCYTVTVAANQSLCNLNFGFKNNNVQLCGFVFVDVNNNGTKDAGEPGIAGQPVKIGTQTAYTNNDGYYVFNKPADTYTLTYTPAAPYTGYSSSPASYTVAATTTGQVYCGKNFGVVVPPSQCDVAVDLIPLSTVTPGFTAIYNIKVYNLNGVTTGGLLTFNFEPGLTFLSASPTQASFDNGSAFVTWNVTNLAPGTYKSFTARLNVPVNTQLGTHAFSFAEFTTNGACTEANLTNNIDTTHQTVVGSYDPNDKHVSPEGNIPNNGQDLVYTIRFQNTGTAPAVNVVILDTLSNNLDWSTFEFKDASHSLNIQREGEFVGFLFSNIMLPDSNTNEAASHGFVSYKIKALPNLAQGTQIKNTASIYFDFNAPIVTNTTLNTIDISLSVSDLSKGNVSITLAPNPMRDYTNISIAGATDAPIYLEVRDMAGRLVQQQISESNILHVNRNNMASGLYVYQLKQNNVVIGKGKMIAE